MATVITFLIYLITCSNKFCSFVIFYPNVIYTISSTAILGQLVEIGQLDFQPIIGYRVFPPCHIKPAAGMAGKRFHLTHSTQIPKERIMFILLFCSVPITHLTCIRYTTQVGRHTPKAISHELKVNRIRLQVKRTRHLVARCVKAETNTLHSRARPINQSQIEIVVKCMSISIDKTFYSIWIDMTAFHEAEINATAANQSALSLYERHSKRSMNITNAVLYFIAKDMMPVIAAVYFGII